LSKAALVQTDGIAALRPNLAWVVLFVAALWHLKRDWIMGCLTFALLCACYAVGSMLSSQLLLPLLGVGITAHAVGHYVFERKPPLVFSAPVAVLEAPAWLLAVWTGVGRRE